MNRRSSPRSRCGPRRLVGVISNDGVVAADDTILGVLLGVVVSFVSFVGVVRAFTCGWGRDGGAGLRCASRLLPVTQRDEFVEESRAWLLDLQDAGQPWYRLLGEWASILVRVPWLALIYRAGRPRRAGR